jgi:predicted RNA-binding Zn ribbon-like protein
VKTGTDAFEAWIPVGGFKLEHRKGKTPDGETLNTDWLVPQWAHDDLAAVRPLAEQPCLHRVLADCPHDQVVMLAGLYGLLTATGKTPPPEPVEIWRREIRELRTSTALWDALAGADATALRRLLPHHQAAKGKELVRLARERLARQVTEKISGGRIELSAPESDRPFTICHRPARLVDAIWQRFAEEIAGMITCARCPAPGCGRWFPRSVGRSDRQFCSHACQVRAWRAGTS